ncbi:MAG: insulinase family protein, partial [Pseudomonadota bacterium]
AHFAMALEAPGYRDPDFYAGQIVATALGGGMASRLFQEAREKRGLCYTIFAQAAAWAETGMLTVYAGTGGEEIAGLTDLTATELARAAQDFTETEIARARTQTKAGLVMGLESPAARAERMAGMVSIWGEVLPLEQTIAKIDAVDVDRARAVLRRIIAARPALALYGPVEAAQSAEGLAARLAA